MIALYAGIDSVYALIGLGLILLLVVVMGIQAHRMRVHGGNEELPGMTGEVTAPSDAHGRAYALVRSEIWRVRCTQPVVPGDTVRVQAVDGLTLEVIRINDGIHIPVKGES